MARFLEISATVILVAATAIAIAFGTAAYFDIPAGVGLCEFTNESHVVCARNWISAAAIFGGFLTIFLFRCRFELLNANIASKWTCRHLICVVISTVR